MKTEAWTSSYTIERLKRELATTITTASSTKTDLLADLCGCEQYGYKIESRKYYHQAYHFLKTGHLATVPNFLISMKDLEVSLLSELANLDNDDRNFVLKQAVGRIFEDINSRLYHVTVSKLLEVQLVD